MKNKNRKNKFRKGFTLVELLLVIVVIAILAGTVMVSGDESIISAEANNIISNMRILKTAALEWIADHGDGINPYNYTITYPWTYLDTRDMTKVGGEYEPEKYYGIPGTISNMLRTNRLDAPWRQSLTDLIEPSVFSKISFHSETAGQGQAFAEEEGYAIVDNGLPAISNPDLKDRSRWYVVYRPKSSGAHASKLKKKLAERAEEFGLFKDTRIPYTADAQYVYMEIIDFDEYFGR